MEGVFEEYKIMVCVPTFEAAYMISGFFFSDVFQKLSHSTFFESADIVRGYSNLKFL